MGRIFFSLRVSVHWLGLKVSGVPRLHGGGTPGACWASTYLKEVQCVISPRTRSHSSGKGYGGQAPQIRSGREEEAQLEKKGLHSAQNSGNGPLMVHYDLHCRLSQHCRVVMAAAILISVEWKYKEWAHGRIRLEELEITTGSLRWKKVMCVHASGKF